METHKRVLGILYIVTGAFQLIGMLILSAIIGVILAFVLEQASIEDQWVVMWLVPLLRVIGFIIIVLFSIPSIISGIGLLYHKKWALTLALILGCFKLLSFPFGTALGIYSIWVYAENHRLEKTTS